MSAISSTEASVEKRRKRLNMLVLALPLQFFTVVALYWLRFIPAFRPFDFHIPTPPPTLLLSCAVVMVLPAFLPPSYFKPLMFERGRLYPALGLRLFRALAPDGDLVNRRLRRLSPGYRVVRDRQSRAAYLAGSIANERWHTGWFLLGVLTMGSAIATRQYGWAAGVAVLNVVFNLYPVLHQRYKRTRLRRPVHVQRDGGHEAGRGTGDDASGENGARIGAGDQVRVGRRRKPCGPLM